MSIGYFYSFDYQDNEDDDNVMIRMIAMINLKRHMHVCKVIIWGQCA